MAPSEWLGLAFVAVAFLVILVTLIWDDRMQRLRALERARRDALEDKRIRDMNVEIEAFTDALDKHNNKEREK